MFKFDTFAHAQQDISMWQRSLVTVPYIVITRHYARAIDEQKSVIPAKKEREKKTR